MQNLGTSWYFWLFWGMAFLGFPIAGVLANLVSAVTTPVRAILAGSIAGATLGIIQWFVLRSRLPSLPIWWVVATSIGMALGLSLSTAFLSTETAGKELLWRAVITGLCIGIAQWIVLRSVSPRERLLLRESAAIPRAASGGGESLSRFSAAITPTRLGRWRLSPQSILTEC